MNSLELKIRLDLISGKKLGGGKGGISHYTTDGSGA